VKQIIQSFKTGETILEEVPAPQVRKGTVLIQTSRSLVSLGTERMLVEFGKSNLISKARQQPDRVKQVLNKIKTEGLIPTLDAVFNKLGEPLALGYCNVGKVIGIGEGVSEFKIGDRVASNGHHAEFVCIPKNLVANIPEEVSDEEACFTVIGSIGLQGIRLLQPSLGETVVVIGMGLIGLLTAQLLVANGCQVIGIDIDEEKLNLSRQWGIIPFNSKVGDSVNFVLSVTGNIGADGVIVTASAKTDEIISQAARMSKKRGRLILVGVVDLNIKRNEFYEKELSFQVSCSYGPGRYDEDYEQRGNDYPLAYVRWTEKRNFEAILHSIESGKLSVKKMITEIVNIEDYQKIYGKIGTKRSIASILKYNTRQNVKPLNTIELKSVNFTGSNGVIGIIGAGNFTKMTMLPALKGSGAGYKYIASAGGLSSTGLAKKYGFSHSTTDYKEILTDKDVDLVLISTRHDKHSAMTVESITAGKNVFVEKPLALDNEQLEQIIRAYKASNVTLTVGYNRRFSPHAIKMKSLVVQGPMNVIATMNAGNIPANVWVHDMKIGGGRIIGEACHYIDLISFFVGSKVKAVCMNAFGINAKDNTDNASILLKYEDGSTGVINYFSNGSKMYSKERIEVYSQNRTAIIDNFRQTFGYGFKGFSKLKTGLDKGHKNQFAELIHRLKTGGGPLIPFDEIINTTKASFAAIESLKNNSWVEITF
jgi:predicted dehydrogenase/threonine dehydrogenase-like Zn-dependent dehydrogenase